MSMQTLIPRAVIRAGQPGSRIGQSLFNEHVRKPEEKGYVLLDEKS